MVNGMHSDMPRRDLENCKCPKCGYTESCPYRGEVERLRERLQFDPGGSDKIDELEQCIQFLRHRIETLEVAARMIKLLGDDDELSNQLQDAAKLLEE
jgi:hypothetical protein